MVLEDTCATHTPGANSAQGSNDGKVLALMASLYSWSLPKLQTKGEKMAVSFHLSSPLILLKIRSGVYFSIEIFP